LTTVFACHCAATCALFDSKKLGFCRLSETPRALPFRNCVISWFNAPVVRSPHTTPARSNYYLKMSSFTIAARAPVAARVATASAAKSSRRAVRVRAAPDSTPPPLNGTPPTPGTPLGSAPPPPPPATKPTSFTAAQAGPDMPFQSPPNGSCGAAMRVCPW
jgi:hypothetical protein